MKITNHVVQQATGQAFEQYIEFDGLGLLVTTSNGSLLSFIESVKYIAQVNQNESIKGIFCTQQIADSGQVRADIQLFVVDEPKWYFFSIVDYLSQTKQYAPTVIAETSKIGVGAYISPVGVVIGENCIIGENSTILADVTIGDNVRIHPGAVIGCDGFEHKKTSRGILSVRHDGKVFIQNNAQIGVNASISKGFSYRPTIIGESSKLDALVHIAHGVQCGKGCLLVSSAVVSGNVDIGDNVWIGPSAVITNRITIGDNAFITLGSVVTQNVAAGEKVTGNFAIPHQKFLQNLKGSLSDD
ncbi:UDP-3-O-(3-hydroxymyristoyl)glucosamine N-acyltransferase [Lonepinella sp. BR2271]|uniref:UDP-3-O-(3-hydroxymyristoyl)glucosamine N-acyltransferase n=1 Tax=Lonepinella sp. BR2271 TaxID=3434550 RepID=UPI003F6DBFBA